MIGVLNTVSASPGGLDLGPAATLAVSQGLISVVFQDPLRDHLPYWGLRWAGDHTNELQALASAGKLTWSESGISNSHVLGSAAILFQDNATYLAIPMRRTSGTIVFLR